MSGVRILAVRDVVPDMTAVAAAAAGRVAAVTARSRLLVQLLRLVCGCRCREPPSGAIVADGLLLPCFHGVLSKNGFLMAANRRFAPIRGRSESLEGASG
ncbi:hypothetical protein CE91St30_24900 [Raoultibacter timonensis]|uniref:Uncharacterized protein n=1 Tax=Raoultibacter timonensis TaxID=1907662 RepID=A0ABM7WLA4_9ACTN|nr:hypothetical protein CE91St30_24900 [Raoultibacter timonensis]BDF51761.1 hypothetical protein CE91St31_24910 [Raoultibacter timonensis]